MENRMIRPGSYPRRYRCVVCSRDLLMKEILTTKAKQVGESECVCETCLPRWKKQQGPTASFTETLDSFAETCAKAWVACEQALPKPKPKRTFKIKKIVPGILDVALEDQQMRMQLLAIVQQDDFHRSAMLDPIIARLHEQKAAADFLRFIASLKDREVAECVKRILESQ